MERRKFLVGMGSLAAGAAAATGTGAFSQVDANRELEVAVAGDQNAFLGLEAGNNGYVKYDSGTDALKLVFDGGSSTSGTGLNNRADTEVENAFSVTNHADRNLYVWTRSPDPTSPGAQSLEFVADEHLGAGDERDITHPAPRIDEKNIPTRSFEPTPGGYLELETGDTAEIDIRWLVYGSDVPRDFENAEIQFHAVDASESGAAPSSEDDWSTDDLPTQTVTYR